MENIEIFKEYLEKLNYKITSQKFTNEKNETNIVYKCKKIIDDTKLIFNLCNNQNLNDVDNPQNYLKLTDDFTNIDLSYQYIIVNFSVNGNYLFNDKEEETSLIERLKILNELIKYYEYYIIEIPNDKLIQFKYYYFDENNE